MVQLWKNHQSCKVVEIQAEHTKKFDIAVLALCWFEEPSKQIEIVQSDYKMTQALRGTSFVVPSKERLSSWKNRNSVLDTRTRKFN